MPRTRTRRAVVILVVYLLATALASYLAFGPSRGGSGGIWLTLLGLPWSLFSVMVSDAINKEMTDYYAPGMSAIAAIVNAFLLHWWAKRDRRGRERLPPD